MEDWQINLIYSTIGIIFGGGITFFVARYFYKKQTEDYEALREDHDGLKAEYQKTTLRLFELAKKEKIVYKEPKKLSVSEMAKAYGSVPAELQPEPKEPKKLRVYEIAKAYGKVPAELQPEPPIKETPSYNLSAGTSTTDPILRDIYDYGKRELGKAIVDSLINSVFGEEEEIYECPECGVEVDYDDLKCPECGADLEEE
jgi:hypothetical protein